VNIGNPDEPTVGEIAGQIIALAGSSSRVSYVPRPSGNPMSRKPDITLARTLLGFEPRIGWRDGLTETIAWFKQALVGPEVTGPNQDVTSAIRIAPAIARRP
jgi:dTDP-glucose 4,6-dehydratase